MLCEVYDLETYINQFLYCWYNISTKEMRTFEVSEEVDDRIEMYEHLSKVTHQIGYNNKGFDYPIIEYIILNKNKLLLVKAVDFAWMIHDLANKLINDQRGDDKKAYYKPRLKIKQLDLFKLNHFDRSKISLKYCAFGLRMENLIDLPVKPNVMLSSEEMDKIRNYVINDVLTTLRLYEHSAPILVLRKRSSLDYGMDCSSMSNTAVARNGFIKAYCEETGLDKYELKNLSVEYGRLTMEDVIHPLVKFKTPKYQKLLDDMLADQTNLMTRDFEYRFQCESIVCDIKKGGLHSLHKPEYFTNKDLLLTDFDFSSYYPYLLLIMMLSPEYLDKRVFLKLVKQMIDSKMAYQKAGDKVGKENAKISVNSLYGLLKSKGSPVRDAKVLYQVTVNGQLFLLMLTEQLELLDNVVVKYQNTDGIMAQYPKEMKEEVERVTKEFEEYIKIPLEAVPMKEVYLQSVSSYIAITEKGDVKRKGQFKKIEDKELKDDSSANIVAIALEQYFVNNIPIKKTILEHQNIFDFYIGMKKLENQIYRYNVLVDGVSTTVDYHDKVIRFYVSKQNSVITKLTDEGKRTSIIKGYTTTMAQNHIEKPMADYKINYSYYIHECNKIIDDIFLCDSQIQF